MSWSVERRQELMVCTEETGGRRSWPIERRQEVMACREEAR
jgi:hypothetical protein